MPSSRSELRGPRPPPLSVNKASWKAKKQAGGGSRDRIAVFYVHSPKVIHTSPQDFMSVVQRLTGKSPPSSSSSLRGSGHSADEIGARGGGAGEDPLLLTLGSSSSMASPAISPSVFFSSPDYTSALCSNRKGF
ncbi:VQ motif-containing protein 20-like [Zingiber officinale]|uniref:VQ domain-containing protein n=1 Tax=Zingiber officinale TaxID=94328 RepID=A0A8J5KTH3_ZINOF|nr:VQ motif-containing protein 20-like [Zingiber officinale]KAG6494709.1 hypothetical protein ZIOFF_042470 [Zingiber officinale]